MNYRYKYLSNSNAGLFETLDKTLAELNVEAEYQDFQSGGRCYRVPEHQMHLLDQIEDPALTYVMSRTRSEKGHTLFKGPHTALWGEDYPLRILSVAVKQPWKPVLLPYLDSNMRRMRHEYETMGFYFDVDGKYHDNSDYMIDFYIRIKRAHQQKEEVPAGVV